MTVCSEFAVRFHIKAEYLLITGTVYNGTTVFRLPKGQSELRDKLIIDHRDMASAFQ